MDEIKKAIESCRWRKDVGGVPVCLGMCTPCEVTIDKGNCEALIEYFEQMRKESRTYAHIIGITGKASIALVPKDSNDKKQNKGLDQSLWC